MSQKLTSKQYKAAIMLATGCTQQGVADRLKLRRETISRWKQKPEFNTTIQQIVRESCGGIEQRLRSLADDSITCIKAELGRHETDAKAIDAALKVLKMLGIDQITPEKTDNAAP